MPLSAADLGTVESLTFDCGCEVVLFDESSVVAVAPCADHENRLTAIK